MVVVSVTFATFVESREVIRFSAKSSFGQESGEEWRVVSGEKTWEFWEGCGDSSD